MTRALSALLALGCAGASLATPRPALAQGWTADLYAGGTRPQGVSAQVTSTSLVGNLRWQGASGPWGYLTTGAPLDDAGALWGAGGFGGRAQRSLGKRLGLGAELSADGYGYRDRVTDTDGAGIASHQIAVLGSAFSAGAATVAFELRGGFQEHSFRGPVDGSRALREVGARASLASATALLIADARRLSGDTTGLFAGVQAIRSFGRGRLWGAAGRWLGDRDQTAWEAGAALTAGRWGELWASVRQDATDPLYGNAQRRAWNVGFSRALGRRSNALPAPSIDQGRVRIRLPGKTVPGSAGAVSVAGEFNQWTRAPMTRSGADWVLELPLARGVYRFAFVTEQGEWFVPEGYPGRMDDDMGGQVAVVVVP